MSQQKLNELEQCQKDKKLLALALFNAYDLVLDLSMHGEVKASLEEWIEQARQIRIKVEPTVKQFKGLFAEVIKEDFNKNWDEHE